MKYTFNYDLLVEGKLTIQDKYNIEKQNGKTNLDFPFYKQICETDPTYNRQTGAVGQYANWLLLRVKTPEELDAVKVPLEWFADGVKRGVLKNSGIKLDISQYHSVDEFVNTMNQVMQGDNSDSFAMSESEQNNRWKLQDQFKIIGTSANWELIQPFTWQVERWFGRETKWCTVANENYFNQYGGKEGGLFIFYPKNPSNLKYRIQACPNDDQFADVNDNVSYTLKDALVHSEIPSQDVLEMVYIANTFDLYSYSANPYLQGDGLEINEYELKEELTADDVSKILNGSTNISDETFYRNTRLKSIVIPNSVTSIGSQAFYGCTSLTSITIPNSVTSIGGYAFSSCTSLSSITIPNSVTSIGNRAFWLVNNIVYAGTATYASDTQYWGAKCMNGYVEGYLVYTDATKTTLAGCSSVATGSITIPNSVTSIGDYAFAYCSSLTSIILPNSVTSIGNGAFSSCTSLSSITIPNSVTSIGDYAFAYCSSLTSIILPNSVTSIGNGAFSRCSSLTSITIPNSVTSIGYKAFHGCTSLTSITIPNSVTSIGYKAFYLVDTVIYNGIAEGAPWGANRVIRNANENKIMISDSSLTNMIYESLSKILEESSNIIHQLGLSKKEAEKRLRKATREYFATNDPHNLEIAEHCTYIVAKAFGFPSKEDVDVCDVNFSWMDSVIGDEIVKIGGSYDTQDVDKHAEKIKKPIKEALKYHQ